jgi:nucleoside-diphosphate-sugar epimerase
MITQKQQIKRLFFVSSTGVYSQKTGEWVDEDSAVEPTDDAGRYLLEGEARVIRSAFPGTVVRFAGIYGPQRFRLLERITRGEEFCAQNGSQYTNLIHEMDCVAILDHLMQIPDPENIYLAVDCQPVDRCFLVTWLASQLHAPEPKKIPDKSLPARLLRSNKRCSNRRLLESGYRFIYPTFQDGYAPLLRNWNDSRVRRQ